MRVTTNPAMISAGVLLALAAAGVQAQQPMYRIVGPDGRVTFSDRAPVEQLRATTKFADAASQPASATLPYELREVVNRYPVTLYTGKDCAPCASARTLLATRGVPFTERTVTNNEDITALKSLSGEQSLPFGTIGGQHLKGFSDAEWTQYLDAAGYPRQSLLPATYRPSQPTPLVAVKAVEAAEPARGETAARAEAPTAPQRPAPNTNPAGIRF